MEGQRQAIELETSGLDVRRGRRLVAIGEKKGIQALVLRRSRQCREEQEKQRASGASPPLDRQGFVPSAIPFTQKSMARIDPSGKLSNFGSLAVQSAAFDWRSESRRCYGRG